MSDDLSAAADMSVGADAADIVVAADVKAGFLLHRQV